MMRSVSACVSGSTCKKHAYHSLHGITTVFMFSRLCCVGIAACHHCHAHYMPAQNLPHDCFNEGVHTPDDSESSSNMLPSICVDGGLGLLYRTITRRGLVLGGLGWQGQQVTAQAYQVAAAPHSKEQTSANDTLVSSR